MSRQKYGLCVPTSDRTASEASKLHMFFFIFIFVYLTSRYFPAGSRKVAKILNLRAEVWNPVPSEYEARMAAATGNVTPFGNRDDKL
jgi:hypothetical protein